MTPRLQEQIGQVFRLTNPSRRMLALIFLLGIVAAGLEGLSLMLFIPLLQSLGANAARNSALEKFFDVTFSSMSQQSTTPLLIALLLFAVILKNVFSFLGNWATKLLEGKIGQRLRKQIFVQTLSSCMDYRTEGRRSDIITVLSDHSWKAASALNVLIRFAISLCTLVVFVSLMSIISFKLVMIAAVSMTICAIIIRKATRTASQTGNAVVDENKYFGLRLLENIQSLQLIRSFGREKYETDRLDDASDKIRTRLLKLELLWSTPAPISEICIALLIGVIILSANWAGVGLAAVAAFLSLLYRSQYPIKELTQSRVWLESLGGAIQEVDDYLEQSSKPFLLSGQRHPPQLRDRIAFRDISFRYTPDDPWVLKNISFDIPVGRTTAIIGPSGAGKSSLMNLLCRFYDPVEGQVLADGEDIREFDLSSWRQRLALMSQDVRLFNDTIESNVGYGDLGADFSDIRRAAQVAHADEFIQQLPKGYATIAGDEGARLSGGQRQRIALARTVLRNPDILLLDEATNALDVESEMAFQQALEQYSHKRTVVVIAHKLTTAQRADRIVVIDQGRLLEVGSPTELLNSGGHFARFHKLFLGGGGAALPDAIHGL